MVGSGTVGTTAELWRFPVKSMLGGKLSEAELTAGGIVGDRAYALVDAETGQVVSAKSVKLFPDLFGCRAAFVEAPRAEGEPPPVRISLPDGTSVTSDAPDSDAILSRCFGRDVHLAPAAPAPEGAFFDLFPISVLTASTLGHLNELRPGSRFDARRFRMNVIVDTHEEGFVENGWLGLAVEIGDAVRLRVAMPDPRCVMTTLAQEDLPRDTQILRTLTRHNRLEIAGSGRFPCAGVYAVVESPGTLRTGDPVVVR